MVVELHCHTSEYSACSYVNAVELITRACEMGMQAIVITDHHFQWSDEELDEIKKRAGLPEIFHVLSGQEFKTSDYGDVLIYGLKETIKKGPIPLQEVRNRYPDAAIVWAHPYRHNKIPVKEKLLNPILDAIEIFSSNYTVAEAARALKDWHELKFTAMAGTDTHALSYSGSYPTIFDHPFNSIEGLVDELKAGRCRPFFKEIPRAGTTDTKVTELTIGPKTADERQKIVVKTYGDVNAWKHSERSHHLVKQIYDFGFNKGTYRVSQPLDTDESNLSLIEERISGKTLFDKILEADKLDSERYLKLAAQWVAKLHNNNLGLTPRDEYYSIEKERLEYYISGMKKEKHPHLDRVKIILDEVWKNEEEILKNEPEFLVQGHGDYHPKNIFIGSDKEEEKEYVAAIDFNSSFQLPKAFDAATFISQYRNMFFNNPDILKKAPADIFLNEYFKLAENLNNGFEYQLHLYKARTNLSIIYYLVKVGKGDSENFWTVLVEAEKSLAHMAFFKALKP